MKRITRLLGTLSLVLALAGCATSRTATGQDPVGRSLVLRGDAWIDSEDGTFAVRIPEGWRLQEDAGSGSILIVNGADARDGLIVVRSFPTLVAPTAEALAQVREGVIEGLASEAAQFHLEEQAETQVGGRRAFQVRYRYELQRTPVVGSLTVVVGDRALYSVSVVAPRDSSRAAEVALRAVLDSLRIDERVVKALTYADPEGRFSLTLPSEWSATDYQAKPEAGQSYHTFTATDGSGSVLMVARLENSAVDAARARQVVNTMERGLLAKLGARLERQVDVRRIVLGGRPALLRTVTLRAGEQTLYLCEAVQVGDGELTALAAYGPGTWYGPQRASLEAIFSSFHFQDAAAGGAVASR